MKKLLLALFVVAGAVAGLSHAAHALPGTEYLPACQVNIADPSLRPDVSVACQPQEDLAGVHLNAIYIPIYHG